MLKLSFILSFLICLLTGAHPKDVTGKWVTDHVEIGNSFDNLPPQQKLVSMMKGYFENASFTLQADHKCILNANIPDMPKVNYWKYDAASGIIILSTAAHSTDKLMIIEVTEQNGSTLFAIKETTAILKVHKVS